LSVRKDTTVSISVPKREKERWQKYADDLGLSVSGLVKKAMTVYLMLIHKKKREIASKK